MVVMIVPVAFVPVESWLCRWASRSTSSPPDMMKMCPPTRTTSIGAPKRRDMVAGVTTSSTVPSAAWRWPR